MELFRYSRNAWGQTVLEGASWDLLWYFVGAGAGMILLHAAYMFLISHYPTRRE